MGKLTRRAMVLAAATVVVAPVQAAGPVTIWLSKQKIGSSYRVKIHAAVSAPGINIPKRYMGYIDVPSSGQVSKTLGENSSAIGLQLQIKAKQLQDQQKVNLAILAKLHAIRVSIVRNI